MAFAGVARESVTIMRGGWATMRRVHRPADEPSRLALDGVRAVAVAVAEALQSA
jgi:hypothetical protein